MMYRKIEKEELAKIIENHKLWLNSTEGERADLSFANLRGTDLSFANLSSANLSFANLSSANLRGADLSLANLSGAYLSSANLLGADLRRADLSLANLSSANLSFANLSSANLSSANLRGTDLSFANLSSANLMVFMFSRHTAYFTLDGKMRIGCLYMPISELVLRYKEIGQANGYSEIEIKSYGQFIEMCAYIYEKYIIKAVDIQRK